MYSSKEYLEGNLKPDELKAHRFDLAQKAKLLVSMPTLKEIEENWPYFLEWQKRSGLVESPSSLRDAFDDKYVVADLTEFFQFWATVQRCYLTVLSVNEGMTIEGVADGCWRPL